MACIVLKIHASNKLREKLLMSLGNFTQVLVCRLLHGNKSKLNKREKYFNMQYNYNPFKFNWDIFFHIS